MEKCSSVQRWEVLYRYLPVEEPHWSEEIGAYIAFGICALEKRGLCWREVGRVSDVSLRREEAARWALLFTEQQLEPVHFAEMVTDFLDRPAVV